MEFKANPLTYLNGFISASRNIFLTSSVGLALFTYSSTFKIQSSIDIVKIASMGILGFAILYGLNTIYSMHHFLKLMKQQNREIPKYIQVNLWENYMYLNVFYITLLFIILVLGLRRFLNRYN